jgi:hypothetical protein
MGSTLSDSLEYELREFMGEMKEFKNTTERRLDSQSEKLDLLKDKVQSNPVCMFHADTMAKIEDQRRVDIKHDAELAEVRKENAIIEVKLTPTEKAQLNAASIGTIILGIWEVVRYVFHITV